jgi:hypothetical protein
MEREEFLAAASSLKGDIVERTSLVGALAKD